jgi:hypothetical protein
MAVRLTENALQEPGIGLWGAIGGATHAISRGKLQQRSADGSYRLGRRAESPIEEYLIELFLASSARSFATYSSELMSLPDVITAFHPFVNDSFTCSCRGFLESALESPRSGKVDHSDNWR